LQLNLKSEFEFYFTTIRDCGIHFAIQRDLQIINKHRTDRMGSFLCDTFNHNVDAVCNIYGI